MKRLILAVILCLFAGSAWGATALEVVDWLPVKAFCADSTYIYGLSNAYTITRQASLTATASTVYTFPATSTVSQIWKGPVDGMLFANVYDNTSQKHSLYKSVNYGADFGTYNSGNPVLLFGDIDGTTTNQIANVDALNRGFLITGGNIYIGEYNVNASRVNGSTNDQVRLMKSINNGDAWTEVAHWNTDGSHNNARHIHAVQTDGTNVFISFGDGNTGSGIMRWDGISTITSNQNLSAYSNTLTGSQQYRTGDILFPTNSNYAFYASDTSATDDPGGTTRGIWKLSKDMSGSTRVDSSMIAKGNTSGWYGAIAPDGSIIFTDFPADNTVSARYYYTSSDGGTTWAITAVDWLNKNASVGGGSQSLFQYGNYFIQDNNNAAGKSTVGSIVFKTNGVWSTANDTTILNPVYWVSTTGTNAAAPQGSRPGTPWLTLNYALTSNRITNGARVILGSGTFNENTTVAAFGANASFPGPSTALTIIEGQGASNTTVAETDAGANTLYFDTSSTPAKIKKLTIYNQTGASANVFNIRPTATYPVYLSDLTIGNASYATAVLIRQNGILTADKCTLLGGATTYMFFYEVTSANAQTTLTNSITNGFSEIFYLDGTTGNTSTLTAYNNTFYNWATRAVHPKSSKWTNIPIVKNCIFSNSNASAYAWYDEAGLTETNTQVAYNAFYGAGATNVNLANNATMTGKVTADPKFKNASLGDFRIKFNSPVKKAGVDVGLTTDFLNRSIVGRIPIGAYLPEILTGGSSFQNFDFSWRW